MGKDLLQNIILKVLEDSSWEILTQGGDEKNTLTIKLANDNLVVTVTTQQTFEVKGANNSAVNELREFINIEIKPEVRKEALKIFQKGVSDWNKWRQTHGQLFIDFSELNLVDKNLSGVNFQNVDMSDCEFEKVNLENANLRSCVLNRSKLIKCDLQRANLELAKGQLLELTGSDLSYAKLRDAELNGSILKNVKFEGVSFEGVKFKDANFTGADLRSANLSGASINEGTIFKKTKGIEIGINGIYSPNTESAGLYSSSPPGNSMKGPNFDAVLESLKRARKYFGFSFLLSLGAMLLWFLEQDSTSIPILKDFVLTKSQYLSISMVFSLGLLVLSKSFLDDAFEGMKYLEDRSSAMSVGSFPWVLTKFTGKKNTQIIVSIVSRIILCLHPLIYLFVFDYSEINYLLIGLLITLTALGAWILFFSFNFQQPILFDQKNEEEKQNNTIAKKLERYLDQDRINKIRNR